MVKILSGVLLLACLLPTQTTSKVVPVKLFFLDDADHSTWCVYANESSWKDAVEKTGADNVATAEIADFKAITIQFTQSDETGDWMVFDEYTVGRDDSMVGLSRRINVLPADRTIEEKYALQNGALVKMSTATRSLTTSKILQNGGPWSPDLPVLKRVQDFPFATLIHYSPTQIAASGQVCSSK